MSEPPPRVALGGSAGTGKTTLGRRLAERLGVPFIEEGMRARLEAGLDLHTLDRKALAALVVELFDETMGQVEAHRDGGFVSDRSPMDFLAFWIYYGFTADADGTEDFADRCRRALAHVGAVVILPWGAIPLADDGIRTANPWRQLHFQTVLEGLVRRRVRADRLHWVPETMTALDDRLAWVADAVA